MSKVAVCITCGYSSTMTEFVDEHIDEYGEVGLLCPNCGSYNIIEDTEDEQKEDV